MTRDLDYELWADGADADHPDDCVDPCLIDDECQNCGCVTRVPVGDQAGFCSLRCFDALDRPHRPPVDMSPTLPADEIPF